MKPIYKNWLVSGVVAGATVSVAAALAQQARAQRLALARQVNEATRHAAGGLGTPARSQFVHVNEVGLHVVEAGPQTGPLAVLLHGFPENWYSWRRQIAALAQAGYRVIAPDQRGYNLSDKPDEVESYQVDCLTGDVRELIRAFGYERAVVVGHDWGGVVAWRFAMDYPDRVERLVVMNAPHPAAYWRELRANWRQRLKAWYVGFFQMPRLPESWLGFWPMATARLLFHGTAVRAGAFSEADLEVMAAGLAQPGALRAMIHWYRAAFRSDRSQTARMVDAPTLLLWGENDIALDKALTYGLAEWAPCLTVHYIPQCGHWVQNEAPDEVNAQILAFLQAN